MSDEPNMLEMAHFERLDGARKIGLDEYEVVDRRDMGVCQSSRVSMTGSDEYP